MSIIMASACSDTCIARQIKLKKPLVQHVNNNISDHAGQQICKKNALPDERAYSGELLVQVNSV